MDENKTFVAETAAENTEQTAEESPKTYTEAEFNAAVDARLNEVMPRKIARKEAKIRKEYERKYGGLEEVLRAGTGKENVDEMTDTFRQFYQSKGINVPQKPAYTDKDIEVLARAEADEIIRGGFDEVVEETDRLASLGVENMTARDKAVFRTLAEYRNSTERGRELSAIGVTEDVYNGKEFQEFASKFNPNTPIRDIYDIYAKTQPKKDIKTMGSMKNSDNGENGLKDFYSYEEAMKFSKADFDKNPELYKRVQESMLKW